jgi:uncharacterized membrane protein
MQDFFTNISRYPRFLLGFVLGVFLAFLSIFQPFLKNTITAVALVGLAIGSFVFLYFTLEAMLGLN